MVNRKRKSIAPKVPDVVPEERNFVNPSAVSRHLYCPICQEPFNMPQRAPCGHSFCHSCIMPWLSSNSSCPLDRKPLTIPQLHHDFIVENVIGDHKVSCPWRCVGCEFVGPLHALASHKTSCSLNPNLLPPAIRDHMLKLIEANEAKQRQALLASASAAPPTTASNSNGGTHESTTTTTTVADDLEGDGDGVSINPLPASTSSSTNSLPDVACFGDSDDQDEDESRLDPAPMPSLVLRLYQNSSENDRDLLNKFIGTSSLELPGGGQIAPTGNRRGGGAAKRRRHCVD